MKKTKICVWPYAYFEIVEHNSILDRDTGTHVRYKGFLGPQATELFERTAQLKQM